MSRKKRWKNVRKMIKWLDHDALSLKYFCIVESSSTIDWKLMMRGWLRENWRWITSPWVNLKPQPQPPLSKSQKNLINYLHEIHFCHFQSKCFRLWLRHTHLLWPHAPCVLNFSEPLISSHRNKVFSFAGFCHLSRVPDPTNLISFTSQVNSRVHPITFMSIKSNFTLIFLCRHLIGLPLCWCLMSEWIWRISSINGVTQKHFSDFCLPSLLALGAHFALLFVRRQHRIARTYCALIETFWNCLLSLFPSYTHPRWRWRCRCLPTASQRCFKVQQCAPAR